MQLWKDEKLDMQEEIDDLQEEVEELEEQLTDTTEIDALRKELEIYGKTLDKRLDDILIPKLPTC
jgi:peptidoglycan hydrolase CwlO-like protein